MCADSDHPRELRGQAPLPRRSNASDSDGACAGARRIPPAFLWAVPALLTVVAVGQIALERAAPLTRWRGGGFGMFSVVDEPGARGLSIFLAFDDGATGRVPINLWNAKQRYLFEPNFRERLRVLPDRRMLERAAEIALSQRYHRVTADEFALLGGGEGPLTWHQTLGASHEPDQALYAAFQGDAAAMDDEALLSPRAVTVQAWRLRFDPRTRTVDCESLGDPLTKRRD